MNKRILSPVEVAQIALKKAMDASAEIRSIANQFFYEQQSTGNVSLTGRLRRFVTKSSASLLAASTNFFTYAAEVIEGARHRQAIEAETQTNFANPSNLARDFGITAGTVFVSAKVFEKLHSLSAVQEFKSAIQAVDVEKIQNSNFIGPLTSEFEAHRELAKSGIEFVREGTQSTFIFPEAIVSKMRQEFGEANATPNDSKCFVLVFKECAQPQGTHADLRSKAHEKAPAFGEPAPVYIPR